MLVVVDEGMQQAKVIIKGRGLGKDAALRAIRRSGIKFRTGCNLTLTPMPHNDCRPP